MQHLADVLAGRETDKVLNFRHQHLSVFGIADEEEMALIKPVARALLARDALRADDYGGLSFGPAAKPILKGEERLEIVLPPKRTRKRDRKARDYPHDPLFEALRARRRDLAAEQSVPPYVIFHDSARCARWPSSSPRTLDALSRISGVGAAKLERYGAAFVEVIAGWEEP